MNTLSDTLNDFSHEILDKVKEYGCNNNQTTGITETEVIMELIEEYVTRIKVELNINKYLK